LGGVLLLLLQRQLIANAAQLRAFLKTLFRRRSASIITSIQAVWLGVYIKKCKKKKQRIRKSKKASKKERCMPALLMLLLLRCPNLKHFGQCDWAAGIVAIACCCCCCCSSQIKQTHCEFLVAGFFSPLPFNDLKFHFKNFILNDVFCVV